ncbi:hypothetical protein BDN70DRAFT_762707, partial [Pholiota conissans]
EDDDQQVTIIHKHAGKAKRHESPPRYHPPHIDKDGDTSMAEDGVDGNPFAPFSSELDWRIAQWVVKDGIGHNSFNRLLEIPGVS